MSGVFHFQNNGDFRDALNIGAQFDYVLQWGVLDNAGVFTPYDLSGYAVRMQVRKCITDDAFVLDFNKADGTGLITDAVNGEMTLSQIGSVTALLTAAMCVYDMEIYLEADPTNVVDRLIQGNFEMTAEVTR